MPRRALFLVGSLLVASIGGGSPAGAGGDHKRPRISKLFWQDEPLHADRNEKLILKAHDNDARLASYFVDWGDGTIEIGDMFCRRGRRGKDLRIPLSHRYQEPGRYRVEVEVDSCSDDRPNRSRRRSVRAQVRRP